MKRAALTLAVLLLVAAAGATGFLLGHARASTSTNDRALASLDASEIRATYHVSIQGLREAAPREWVVTLGNGHCVAINLDHFYVQTRTRYAGIASVACPQ